MIDIDRLERLAREIRWPEEWSDHIGSVGGDTARRKDPSGRLNLNASESWAVGPARKTGRDATNDAAYIAACSPDVLLKLLEVVRAAREYQAAVNARTVADMVPGTHWPETAGELVKGGRLHTALRALGETP